LEDASTRPNHNDFGSPFLLVRKGDGSLRLCIGYRGINKITRKDAYRLPYVNDTLDEPKDANLYTHIDLAIDAWPVQCLCYVPTTDE
jgi:hypothetical protein